MRDTIINDTFVQNFIFEILEEKGGGESFLTEQVVIWWQFDSLPEYFPTPDGIKWQ
jgi:hypothetical protein